MKARCQEVSLREVMDYYAKGFNVENAELVRKPEYFVDPVKGKVIFKLFVEESAPNKNEPTST